MTRKRKTKPGPYLLYLELLRERIADPCQFPFSLPAVRNLTTLDFHPQVTFLVGENGTGKSTLLEAIAVCCGMNPEGGGTNFHFETRASHSSLDQAIRLGRTLSLPADNYFLRAETFYNVASEIEVLDRCKDANRLNLPKVIDSYGQQSLHEQSHGESFFAVFQNRFGGHGLYLLDEPEAALSPSRQLEFLSLLHSYVQQGSQFIIATHSPIIMAYPQACLYLLDTESVREVAYTETTHYKITHRFMSNPERAISAIIGDDSERKPLQSGFCDEE